MQAAMQLMLGLTIALLGAVLAILIHLPLPWLLGPLLLTAAARIAGLPTRGAAVFNVFGRWSIGLALGLYFTPAVAASVVAFWPLIVFGMAYAIGLAFVGSWVYRRWAGLDATTAWFAAAIGSAGEMAHLAQQHGARTDQVASAHSMRVLLIVVIVPLAFQLWLGQGAAVVPPRMPVDGMGLAALMAGAGVAGWVCERLRVPNGWMLGALGFAMAMTLLEVPSSAIPSWLSWAGQLCIGWTLGDRYRPDFLRSAPRLMAVVAVQCLLFMVVSAVLGWCIAVALGLPVATLILALVPGGIAEMTITAKVLGLGVPLVTAMQVSRMLCVVLLTGWLYRLVWGDKTRASQ